MSTTSKNKSGGLSLGRLSQVAQMAIKPGPAPDDEIEIGLIDFERQVRKKLGDLTPLAASIKEMGVQQPVILLKKPDGRFRAIAGERRIRASGLAGKLKVPAIIKIGLNEFQIRQIQVTENNDREDLTPYDEAMGVAEDVEAFGFQEALKIWNRSEGWISKRTAVPKYAAPVLEVMQSELCGDLEILHSLNQLFAVNEGEYEALVQRLRSGDVVSRDDVRNKVSAAKTWKKTSEAVAKELREPGLALKTTTSDAGGARQAVVDAADSADEGAADIGAGDEALLAGTRKIDAKAAAKQKTNKTKNANPPAASSSTKQGVLPTLELTAEQKAAATREAATAKVEGQRRELMEWGYTNYAQVNSLQHSLQQMGCDLAQGEWALWTGFLDTILPMLVSLGPDRAAGYLQRLQEELKKKDALTIWQSQHQVPEAHKGDMTWSPVDVPQMPDGWTF